MKSQADAGLDPVVQEAKDRFKRCKDWEAEADTRFRQDVKFVNGDSENGWQWEDSALNGRINDNRPALTINQVRQFCLQIINDAKQNKPSVTIRPVGNGATYDAARVYEGIVRHIEYISGAENVYDNATTFQVWGGIGYWRVVTGYADSETFDQDIFLRRVKDPRSVHLDPDINEIDGSDARFGFIFEDVPTDQFKKDYPQYADAVPPPIALNEGNDWLNEDHVRIAEYYRVVEKQDKLLHYVDDQGAQQTVRASKLPPEVVVGLLADQTTRVRDITTRTVEWKKIVGDKVVEKNIWPGQYIPIVRIIGEETVIDGKMDRKGHVRYLKDAQRQYNWMASAETEFVALQDKTPYIAPARAIEGLEGYWEHANTENRSILPYNDIDDSGQPIQKPERAQPPTFAAAYIQGMQLTRQQLMETSGQFQAQLGEPSNEKSGKAIQERQRQGDNATYHFIDGLAIGIRYTGKILIDIIPKIYDTPGRIARILGEDGTEQQVEIQPGQQQAHVPVGPEDPDEAQRQARQAGAISAIFNPNVGQYDVQADIGPDYGTQRQETFNATSQILQSDTGLMPIIGDIMFKAADFPMADEIAERLHRMVPAQALGGPNPEVVQLQQQVQGLGNALQAATEALADAKKDQASKLSKASTDQYRAETDRLGLATDIDPLAIVPVIRATVMEALADMLKGGGAVPQLPSMPVIGSQTQPPMPQTAQ